MKMGNLVAGVSGMVIRSALIVGAVYIIYKGSLVCYDYGYRVFTEPALKPESQQVVTVAITKDMSAKEIGAMFESKGLIGDAKLFVLQYYLSEYRADVKPGVYDLSPSMTVEQMMEARTVVKEESTDDN